MECKEELDMKPTPAGGREMKTQYDDEAFFSAYGRMERSKAGLRQAGSGAR